VNLHVIKQTIIHQLTVYIRQSYNYSHASYLTAVHKFTLAGCFKILKCSVLFLLSIMWPFSML